MVRKCGDIPNSLEHQVMPSTSTSSEDRLLNLEILRFIAAVSVLLYHYQHFITYRGDPYVPDALPFSDVFGWFYRSGGRGVEVFWLLSGFVFINVYEDKFLERRIGAREFFVRRFSRLYPLQWLSLFVTASLTVIFVRCTGLPSFIYDNNDFRHFVLNVLFINYWGFQNGTSFNGPSWSVSVELISYGLFLGGALTLSRIPHRRFRRYVAPVVWGIGSICAQSRIDGDSNFIAMSAGLFMMGAFCASMQKRTPAAGQLIAAFLLVVDHVNGGPVHRFLVPLNLPFTSLCIAVFIVSPWANRILQAVNPIRRISIFLGSLTYSLYMIHYPVQLVFAFVHEEWGSLDFLDPLVWFTFYASVFVLAIPTYLYFEVPMRNLFRGASGAGAGSSDSAATPLKN